MNSLDDSLRKRAEQHATLRSQPGAVSASPENLQRLLHELRVHEIELELQNEELRISQTQLLLSNARYLRLYDYAPIGYLTLDRSGRITQINQACAELLRLDPKAILGTNLAALTHETDTAILVDLLARTFGSNQRQFAEVSLKTIDSRVRTVQLHTLAALESEPTECLAVLLDVTERRQAEVERERLLNELNQAQKMESVGQLAGGIAHDFNNMLQAILGNLELIFIELPDESPLRESLKEIQRCATHSAELTRQLLGFARKQDVNPRNVDVNETIESMLKVLRRLIGENLELIWQPTQGLPHILIDPVQLNQILVNLCVNSRDAITGAGCITLKTYRSAAAIARIPAERDSKPTDYVTLSVTDTGCGMPQSVMDHLFEPFFTTKGIGQGTGLGLASVYGVVKQNHGHVQVESEPGRGSTFFIHFPCCIEPRS